MHEVVPCLVGIQNEGAVDSRHGLRDRYNAGARRIITQLVKAHLDARNSKVTAVIAAIAVQIAEDEIADAQWFR